MFDLSRLGDWGELPFFATDLPRIEAALAAGGGAFLPPAPQVFAALERTPPRSVRAVILGQDPYPAPGQAHGFAFSVAPGTATPRSLANILAELRADLGQSAAESATGGDLRPWADQGVLLLNTVLTVPEGLADGHRALGWQRLTAQILARLSDRPRAFLLWGRKAQATALGALERSDHLRLLSSHPSPLGAHAPPAPFLGSRPFSAVNRWLASRGEPPIDWRL